MYIIKRRNRNTQIFLRLLAGHACRKGCDKILLDLCMFRVRCLPSRFELVKMNLIYCIYLVIQHLLHMPQDGFENLGLTIVEIIQTNTQLFFILGQFPAAMGYRKMWSK